jgi:CheY-like chemotaxis protein
MQTIPVIAMTANAFEEDRKMVMEAGMNGYVTKPIDEAILIREIKRVYETL